MLSLQEMLVLMGVVTADPTLPTSKPKVVGVDPVQVSCLADNVYFESGNQGTAGWSVASRASPTSHHSQERHIELSW